MVKAKNVSVDYFISNSQEVRKSPYAERGFKRFVQVAGHVGSKLSEYEWKRMFQNYLSMKTEG